MSPTFSIVTPSYNQGQYLEKTIQSVLQQAGDFFIDYIIADGGSTDESVAVIKKYEELLHTGAYPIQCKGITYRWWSKKDKGQSDAINQGLAQARGEILAWINSDDFYETDAFSVARSTFEQHPDVDLVYGDCHCVNEGQHTVTVSRAQQADFETFLSTAHSFGQSSSFFTKRIILQTGLLDETLHYAMDFDLWLRISKLSRILYVPFIFSTYRLWAECKSVAHEDAFFPEKLAICKKYDRSLFAYRYLVSFYKSNIRWIESIKRLPVVYAPLRFVFRKVFARQQKDIKKSP